jgi:dienelactone hydrolase
MGTQKNSQWTILVVVSALLTLGMASCGLFGPGVPDPEPYKRSEPTEFYLYAPENYNPQTRIPVFIGIHGQGGNGLHCWNDWQPYADTYGYLLVCPSLADEQGGWLQDEGNAKLNSILNTVYSEYTINTKFFLAGFSAGAQFVQGYAMSYPNSVAGVSVISAGNFYPVDITLLNIKYLITVGDRDRERIDPARRFQHHLDTLGAQAEVHVIPGVGHAMSEEARELTLQFFQEIFP